MAVVRLSSFSSSPPTLVAENLGGLAPGLKALLEKPPLEQAHFWRSCVSSQQKELQELGGLPLDTVFNDVLTRYFDSSCRGINIVYDCAVRDQKNKDTKLLEKDGMYDALSEHYCFFDAMEERADERDEMLKACSNEVFERICETVGIPCEQESFAHAIRRLRIAVLLYRFHLHEENKQRQEADGSSRRLMDRAALPNHGQVYHCDYDDDNIWTPFNRSARTQRTMYAKKGFNVPIVKPQDAIVDLPNYLFISRQNRYGNVHWVHLQFPSTEMLLAVGQVWRLPGPELSLLCDMKKAQPQISCDKPDRADKADPFGYSWSSLIMPCIFLDPLARESLHLYRNWFESTQDSAYRHHVSEVPPRVRVAVTKLNMTMLWSSPKARTLLSMCSEASYIGKWNTDVRKHTAKSYFQTFIDAITCRGCCVSRKKDPSPPQDAQKGSPRVGKTGSFVAGKYYNDPSEGRKNTEQKDPDEETPLLPEPVVYHEAGLPISAELASILEEEEVTSNVMGEKVHSPGKKSTIQFEKIFEKVLQSLERPNSMLRLGNHMQLLLRIMANRSADYLDVLEVYEAGITRLKYLLRDFDTHDKDDLVAKIALAKLELNALERLIKPFSDFVVKELYDLVNTDDVWSEFPLVLHHIKDTQNNVRTFLPKCEALIQTCSNLTDEYDRIANDKMNNILNILTFITFVITPAQLLTGLYGMNFRIMPELDWHHGYLYFWMLAVSLSITFGLVLVCLKRSE